MVCVALYTNRICEFERLYCGFLWSGHSASSVFLAILFGATVLQCSFSCILFGLTYFPRRACRYVRGGCVPAASGSTDWSRMHPDLYNFHTRSPVTTSAASGSSTSSALSLTAPLGSSGNPRSSQFCHSWNAGRCRWPFGDCRFRHSCEACHRDHPSISCPHRSARRDRSHSPTPSKGGPRCH